MGVVSNQLFQVSLQNAEFDQAVDHDADHRAGHFLNRSAGAEQGQRRFQRLKNDIVNRALCWAELAIHRKGAGDVTSVTAVFTPRVDQH
ncbi:hypothetical protein D3C77_749070 [compost metagenome]